MLIQYHNKTGLDDRLYNNTRLDIRTVHSTETKARCIKYMIYDQE